MGLTFRTGSGGKGSALTIEELDNNFRHFTGSHDVSGSFGVTGSIVLTGSLDLDGIFTNSLLQISQSVISAPGGAPVVINDQLSLNGNNLIAVTNITASANISASGNIISNLSLVNTSTLDSTAGDDAKLTVLGNAIFGEGANGKVILSDDYLGGELGVMTVSDHTIAAKFSGEGYRYGGLYGAEPLRITDSGKVGIGVNVPSDELEVNGAVKIGEGNIGYVIIGDDYLGSELGMITNSDKTIAAQFGFTDDEFRYGGDHGDEPLIINKTNITASANISASGDIFGQTGSFAGGLVLTSPNGTQYAFTTNNDGHLSLTGSAI